MPLDTPNLIAQAPFDDGSFSCNGKDSTGLRWWTIAIIICSGVLFLGAIIGVSIGFYYGFITCSSSIADINSDDDGNKESDSP